jgi:hypothetical protein
MIELVQFRPHVAPDGSAGFRAFRPRRFGERPALFATGKITAGPWRLFNSIPANAPVECDDS